LQGFGGRNVVLLQLVRVVKEHDLSKGVHSLEGLWLNAGYVELKLQ
jgi:hypothetical protein